MENTLRLYKLFINFVPNNTSKNKTVLYAL